MNKEVKILNFRDLGTIECNDSRRIKNQHFYRGPALLESRLTNEDKMSLNELGIKHIFDFRGYDEILHQGSLYIPDGTIYHHVPAIIKNDRNKTDDLNTMSEEGKRFIEEWLFMIYRQLPIDNPAYKEVMKAIKNHETPIYFNCSVGKDRTGVCACLIELLLDAKEEEIYRDYMISHHNYYNYYKSLGMKDEEMNKPSLCNPAWLDGTLDEIKTKYDNLEVFFEQEYDVTVNELKALRDYYLE